MDFKNYHALIETTIAFLGLNPVDTRGAEEGQWTLQSGEFELYIDLWQQDKSSAWMYFESEEPVYIFQVTAPVCFLPNQNLEKLYEELLHNNLNMLFASYTINKSENMLAVKYRRICNGLKQEDIVESIESVGYYAQQTIGALEDRYDIKKIDQE